MAHISGHDRSQTLLFPESVDDYVGPDNPVRFIDAFVDGLDLAAAGFVGVCAKPTGRPGYAPADLLKLYIYGYLNRIRSSRRLEAETHRNIEVIWLLRHLKPDFKTIADFRLDNRAAFKPIFREFVLLCRQLDLFGRELLAVDGTRLKAVNNKDRNFTRSALDQFIRKADECLAGYLRRLDDGDVEEGGTGGSSRVPNLAEKIEAIRTRHRQLVALRLRERAIRTACPWLRRSGHAGDLGPSLEGLAPGGAILDGRHLMAAEQEEVVDFVMGGKEALCLAGRLEPLHLPLSSSSRLVGVLRPVVQSFVLPVLDGGHHLSLRSAVTGELVGDHDARRAALPLQQLA